MLNEDQETFPISSMTPKQPSCYGDECKAKTLFSLLGDENSCFWQAPETNRRNCWSFLPQFRQGCKDINIVDGKRGETADSLGITGLHVVKPRLIR